MGLGARAYSSVKPAYGVGPGNAPCYVEARRISEAASDIVVGKTFDNGLLCSSPNSVVVDAAISEELKASSSSGRLLSEPAEIVR